MSEISSWFERLGERFCIHCLDSKINALDLIQLMDYTSDHELVAANFTIQLHGRDALSMIWQAIRA